MATTHDNAIQQLYVAYFNRPADPAGLEFWAGVMEGNGGDTSVISAEFAKSTEYTTEYDQLTTSGVVTQVYQNLFGHAPDSAGLAFWVNALNTRAMTVDTMVTEIAKGAQGTDKVAFDSKVVVATAFTTALDTDAEVAGFNTEEGLAAAKELIATIETAEDATAAIVPATLDASVAAVVKAGTPFTLASGLAALGAAQEALADFLEEQEATAAEIRADVAEAEGDLVDLIADEDFADASAGVQAALIADQTEYNADALEAANEALEAVQEEIEGVDGLGDAIAAVTLANDAADEAEEARDEAMDDRAIAESTFEVRNDLTLAFAANGTATATIDGVTSNFIVLDDGALVLDEEFEADDFTGLDALLAAANAATAAEADLIAADDAALLAQMEVVMLENETTAAQLTAAFDPDAFTVIEPGTSVSFGEIADELSGLAAAGDADAYDEFRELIETFNDQGTPLADEALEIEQGLLARAQAAVAAVTGLAEADALNTATEATAAAETDLVGVEVDDDGNVVLAGTATVVATLTEGELELEEGYKADDYAGLADYIDAVAAQTAAEAAFEESGATVTADALLADTDNQDLLAEVEEQQGYIDAAPSADEEEAYADYIAALGVEGAQAGVDDLAEALEALEEAQALEAQLDSLEEAIDAATDDFTANDFNAPTMLENATAFGRTGSDIFVVDFTDEENTDITISNFGRSGDDVLYIGSGYTLNTGDVDEDGSNTALEVFFVQQGNNVVVTVETEAFGSNSGEAEIEITLTGVDADDLTFENGIITI